MAFIESQQNPGVVQEVDPASRAGRVSIRPLDHTTLQGKILGHYRVGARSGALTGAAIVAGAPLFSARWTDPTNFMVITLIEATYTPTTLFTAFQELGLDSVIARAFTSSDTAGTAISVAGSNQKVRTNMGTSLVGDMRIAAATLLTAGVRTLDAAAFVAGSGGVNQVNAAAGTPYINPSFGATPYGFRFEANPARGESPIVLAANEGVLVRNTVIFPAAGVATLTVNIVWAEVAAY